MARPMTRTQLRDEVRARIGETSTGFFTDANLNQWLNDGVSVLAIRLEPIITQMLSDITATTGSAPWRDQSEFLLPDNLISIKQVYIKQSDGTWTQPLTETTYEDLFEMNPDWESSEADPASHYYWRMDVLGLYPKVKTTRTDALRVLHTCVPAEMTSDSATAGLPSYMDRSLIQYAVYRARMKDKDEERAGVAMAEFEHLLNQAGMKVNKPRKDHAPMIYARQNAYRMYYGRIHRRTPSVIMVANT